MLEQTLFNSLTEVDQFGYFDPFFGDSRSISHFDLVYRPTINQERFYQTLAERIIYLAKSGNIEDKIKSIRDLLESVLSRSRLPKISY